MMQKVDQSMIASDHLLKALWHAEYQGRFGLYRAGIILLADMGIEFDMAAWGRRLLEEVIPQVSK